MPTKKSKRAVKKSGAKKKTVKRVSIPKGVAKKKTVHTKTRKDTAKKKNISVKKKRVIGKKKRALVVAHGTNCFWVHEGPILRDLVELRDALFGITREQFLHHVNNMKNDFAQWVGDVLEDKECAEAIGRAKTVPAMIRSIEKALTKYEIKVKKRK